MHYVSVNRTREHAGWVFNGVSHTWKRGQIVLFDLNEVLRTLWERNINFEKKNYNQCSDRGYKM